MRKILVGIGLVALVTACNAETTTAPISDSKVLAIKAHSSVVVPNCGPRGTEGWDFTALMFRGRADGADFNWDCMYLGDSTLGRSHLIIKWDHEYERGINENWSNPPYNNAGYNNLWNGKAHDGTDQIVKIVLQWTSYCANPHIPEGEPQCVGPLQIMEWSVMQGHERFVIVALYHPRKR